jgi:uncharacterized protein (TIGR02271 family)
MSQDNAQQLGDWIGRTAVDTAGDKVGKITDVYVDDTTGAPDWLTISTGLFGSKVSFVPIEGARVAGDDVMVGFDKAKIKDAPNTEADGALSVDEEQTLYAYYGRGYTPATEMTTQGRTAKPATVSGETAGRDASMVRSEEELSINKSNREAGRVKLRKWVETENVQVTVPVEKQMAKVVREPVRDGDTAGVGAFTEGEEEIVLSEEVVDVSKRAVAKERVGLEKETVTEQVPVNETVRKERVGVEGGELVGETRGGTPKR